jgi:GNAT superfamily N-acetyltransferase
VLEELIRRWRPAPATFRRYLRRGRVKIRRAERADFPAMVRVLASALAPTAFGEWLIEDHTERRGVFPQFMAIIVNDCLERGAPQVAEQDGEIVAVALWFPGFDPRSGPVHYETELEAACGPHTRRFQALDKQLEQTHMQGPHDFLAFVAVDPTRQNRGYGRALLQVHLRKCDEDGRTAFLDASDANNLRLYMRLGWRPDVTAYLPDGGPAYWPCRRAGVRR